MFRGDFWWLDALGDECRGCRAEIKEPESESHSKMQRLSTIVILLLLPLLRDGVAEGILFVFLFL